MQGSLVTSVPKSNTGCTSSRVSCILTIFKPKLLTLFHIFLLLFSCSVSILWSYFIHNACMDSEHKAISSWMLLHKLKNVGLTLSRILGNSSIARKIEERCSLIVLCGCLDWIFPIHKQGHNLILTLNQERAWPFFLLNFKRNTIKVCAELLSLKHVSMIVFIIFLVQFILKNLLPLCLQAGFAAEGAESGTPFNDINLLEKVCCLSFISQSNYLAFV